MKQKDPSCFIGYRLLNADLDKATKAFLRFFECLYEQELKQSAKVNETQVDADVLDARAKLAAKFGKTQVGGKGTQRRTKKVVHK